MKKTLLTLLLVIGISFAGSAQAQGLSCESLRAAGFTEAEIALLLSMFGGGSCPEDNDLETNLENLIIEVSAVTNRVQSSTTSAIKADLSNLNQVYNNLESDARAASENNAQFRIFQQAERPLNQAEQLSAFLGLFDQSFDTNIKSAIKSNLLKTSSYLNQFLDLLRNGVTPPQPTPPSTNGSLEISESRNNPDAAYIEVDEDYESDEYEILVFDLENDTDDDVLIEEIEVVVNTDGTNPRNVVADAVLEFAGEEYDEVALRTVNREEVVYEFEVNTMLDDDDEDVGSLILSFKRTSGNYESGQHIEAWVESDNIKADAAVSGKAYSDEHKLVLEEAITLTTDNFKSSYRANSDNRGQTASVTYTLGFDVTATGGERLYIPKSVKRGGSSTSGVRYVVENSRNVEVDSDDATSTAAFTSTADSSGNYYIIEPNSTEAFTVNVAVEDADTTNDSDVPGFVRIQLEEMDYYIGSTGTKPDGTHSFSPQNDFDTALVSIEVDNDGSVSGPTYPELDIVQVKPYGQNGSSVGMSVDWTDVPGASKYVVTTTRTDFNGSATVRNTVRDSAMGTGAFSNAGESRGYCYNFEVQIEAQDASGKTIYVTTPEGSIEDSVTVERCYMATPGRDGINPTSSGGEVQGASTTILDQNLDVLRRFLDQF